MQISEALAKPCVIDTSLLSNFLYSGNALILSQLLNTRMNITPVVLDPAEISALDLPNSKPTSEVLRPLFSDPEKRERYAPVQVHILNFARAVDDLWAGIVLTDTEVILASSFRERSIWNSCITTKRKRGLGPGEAEVLAVAITRDWTALIDDQAAVELLKCLSPDTVILRTCGLLVHAVEKNLLNCAAAEDLFNVQICGALMFNSRNSTTGQHIRLRCNPTRCAWESSV